MAGSLSEQTRDFILGLGDVDLAEYVETGTTLYEPEAVEFARREFQRRNIDLNIDLNQVKVEVAARKNETVELGAAAAELPLHGALKFVAFLGGFFITSLLPIVLLMVASHGFRQRGELRRASEMWRFVGYGVITLLSLFMLTLAIVAYSR